MSHQPITIVGFVEEQVEPLFGGTAVCRVPLELSGPPPRPWIKLFRWWLSEESSIGQRVEVEPSLLILVSDPNSLERDLDELHVGLDWTNAEFEREEAAAIAAHAELVKALAARFPGRKRFQFR